jgi:predicted outer membrane repeat protein
MAMQAHAATITVTNLNDSGPGSLRQALAGANNGDTINFAVIGTIILTSGGLGITKNVTISGPGANQLAVNGNQGTLGFGLPPQITVSISGLTIRNAQYGISNNQSTVSVSNCVLSGNSVAGLYNFVGQDPGDASMTVANSIISNNSGTGALNVFASEVSASNTVARNSADQLSGGVPCACMTITDSVVSNNTDGIQNFGFARLYGATATLTVVNSDVSDNDDSGISNEGTEGYATATIFNTTVTGNSAGGALTFGSFGSLAITNSTVSGNSTYGGITAHSSYLSIANSDISSNSAADSGGGIYDSAFDFSIVNSTISGNSAGTSGGGIYCQGIAQYVHIMNSTISGNSAGTSGGGIYNFSCYNAYVANSTITGNSAGSGGGMYNNGPYGRIQISNTIINAGASGENIFNSGGTVPSLGYNLSSDDGGGYLNGPGDQINTDPLLGPLQDNGGPTFTHALLPGSPAIDAGDPSFTPPPLYDQRGLGFDRVVNGHLDIGSFEVQAPTPSPTPTSTPSVTPSVTPTPTPRATPRSRPNPHPRPAPRP